MTDPLPPYDDIDLALEDVGAGLDAAGLHGLLAGMACVDTALPSAVLRGRLDEELDVSMDDGLFSDLQSLDRIVHAQLRDEDYGFELLLPEDDVALPGRVAAFASWCEGFLAGFGGAMARRSTPGSTGAGLSADVETMLATIGDFTRAELGADELGEEAERDYMELVEYLRVAVLTLFAETAGPDAKPPAGRH